MDNIIESLKVLGYILLLATMLILGCFLFVAWVIGGLFLATELDCPFLGSIVLLGGLFLLVYKGLIYDN